MKRARQVNLCIHHVLLMFILSNVKSIHVVMGLKFMHLVINLQIIVFKFIYNQREVHYWPKTKVNNDNAFLKKLQSLILRQKALVQSDKTDYLSRLPFTSIQITQQPKVAIREFVTVFFLQTLAISRIDGGEVAAVHCRPSLRFCQNQRHQLRIRAFIPSTTQSLQ